mmetsp:Transcript_21691/g.20801  ORF Transcript_21691/g.20801 Transcript_21691/m.20801 type:complete len:83 (-) Transcript_21691:906-1154(-)
MTKLNKSSFSLGMFCDYYQSFFYLCSLWLCISYLCSQKFASFTLYYMYIGFLAAKPLVLLFVNFYIGCVYYGKLKSYNSVMD